MFRKDSESWFRMTSPWKVAEFGRVITNSRAITHWSKQGNNLKSIGTILIPSTDFQKFRIFWWKHHHHSSPTILGQAKWLLFRRLVVWEKPWMVCQLPWQRWATVVWSFLLVMTSMQKLGILDTGVLWIWVESTLAKQNLEVAGRLDCFVEGQLFLLQLLRSAPSSPRKSLPLAMILLGC